MKKHIFAEDTFVDMDGEVNDGKYLYSATDDGNAIKIELYDVTGLSPTLTMPETFMSIPVEEIFSASQEGVCGRKLVKRIRFSKNLRIIGYQSFFEFKNLKRVTIPENVDEIGDCAFGGCSSLEGVFGAVGIVFIGNDAFSGCKSLSSIKLAEGVTRIGDRAFMGCESLKKIKIGRLVNYIGELAFSGCDSLEKIEVDIDNHLFHSYDGVLYSDDESELIKYPDAKEGEIFLMPDRVETVKYEAFAGAKHLRQIYISDHLRTIEGDDFTPNSDTPTPPHAGSSYRKIGMLYDRIEVYARFERK